MKGTFITLLMILMSANFALEGDQTTVDDYYQVSEITMSKVDGDFENYVYAQKTVEARSLGDFITATEKLIALGTKVWEIVKAGEPNLNLTLAKPISILPNNGSAAEAFSELDSWSAPKVNSYFIEFKNVYGVALVSFRYNVAFQYNGSLNGKGRYITGLQVNASSVNVVWGVSFDATSELQSISNRGSKEDPIAGVTMNLTYKVGTFLSKVVQTQSFHMAGDGEFTAY